jgi:Ca-activated chloride channel family protein
VRREDAIVRARFAATAVLCSALVATAASTQQVYVTLCHVHFVVTDRNGLFVKDLGPDDFTVYDNDRPQEISTFAQRVQSPVSVALVLDRSQSLSDRFPFVLDSAAAFAKSIIREGDDQGAVVAFDSKVYLLQNWTADSAALVDNIRKLTAAGGTSIFDALSKTCRDQFDGADTRQKVVVLVTDGEDTTSVATFDEALRMAKLARVAVYVLGVRAENSLNSRELQGRRVLASLAELTGGRVFYPADYGDASLSALFAKLQEELRNGYNLTYSLDVPPDNTFHRIRIDVKNRSLNVHAPTGYDARQSRQVQ